MPVYSGTLIADLGAAEEIARMESRAKEVDAAWQISQAQRRNHTFQSSANDLCNRRSSKFTLWFCVQCTRWQSKRAVALGRAEGFRQQAEGLRQKKWIYRELADNAKKELRSRFWWSCGSSRAFETPHHRMQSGYCSRKFHGHLAAASFLWEQPWSLCYNVWLVAVI